MTVRFSGMPALPDILLFRDGKLHKNYPSSTLPLGITDGLNLIDSAHSISLEKEDRLYSFSDGIVEAKADNEEMFGMEMFEEFLGK